MQDIFDFKLKDFYFCSKLCSHTNLSALVSNMKIVFQNCYRKHSKKAVLVPYLGIFNFARKFVF